MSTTPPPLTGTVHPEIWVALDDPAARLRLQEAAGALEHRTRIVAPGPDILPASCVAIVSDLDPPGPTLDWLEELRSTRQGIPIILYLPVRTGADAALSRAMAIGVDGLVFQRGKRDERDRLRDVLQTVLDLSRVASLLDRLAITLPRSPTGFRLLKHYGIKMAKKIDSADHVETVAAALGASPRTLQRLLRTDGWPGPKELLDWMMLFLVALAGSLPLDKTVRRRVRRAGQRLLGQALADAPPVLDAVIEAFRGRLRASSR